MNQAGHDLVGGVTPRWKFLAGLMQELGFTSFVEVGCKEGRTTGFILDNVPESRVIAVDPWMPNPAPANGDIFRETYTGDDWDFEEIEKTFWENVGENRARVAMQRCTSIEAARGVADGSQDLVFIDALHDQESVAEDIAAWWPKVREGGILAGHDFNHRWPGVERAVANAFDLMQVGVGTDSVWFVMKP